MNTNNPYAPPTAEVSDILEQDEAGVQPIRQFSAKGRIGRLRYLAYILGSYMIFLVVLGVFSALSIAANSSTLTTVIIGVLSLVYFVYVIMLGIQRSHDMDWSGWTTLLIFIPLVGFIWLFKAGTPGRNRFGAPPPPNTTGVKVLGWILSIFFVIGIVAAIALPAYQAYTMRAKAMQMR